jgi:hypothetical protein
VTVPCRPVESTAASHVTSTATFRRSFAAVLVAAALLLLLAGCSHYGFSSSVKTHISTIAIPVLVNETLEYGVEQGVTEALIAEFTEDNAMRVVGEKEADSILRGVVVLYERPVISYDASGDPREYKVRVVAKLSYEDLTRNEIVWEDDVEGWAVYSEGGEGGDLSTEDEAKEYAFEKLAQDVLSKTVQGW